MTKSIDNEIVTKEHLDDLTGSVLEYENARRWSYDWNSMHCDQKSDAGRTALLNEIDKTIAEYKELGEYQSIGERNVPDEVNAGEIDDREDKI